MKWWFSKAVMSNPAAASQPGVQSAVAPNECADLDRLNADLAIEYIRSIYLWRCIDMIAQMSSSVPLIVFKPENAQLRASELAVQGLLARPNPQWNGSALQYWVAASIAVSNKAFLLRVRNGQGVTLELWPIGVKEVQIIYDEDSRMIERFDVMWNGQQRRFPVDPKTGDSDIIYIRRPALNWQTDKSPATIAAAPAEVYTKILQRCYDIVRNSSNITGLLSTDAELSQGKVLEIKDKIRQFMTGGEQSGGTLVTANAKWQLTRLSEDPASALSVAVKDSIARDVTMTFGVPTQLVGLPGTDTYNNLAMARVGFLTDCILPGYIGLYVAGLNQALMSNGAQIKPDTEHIPAMLAAQQQLTDTAAKATMLSVNEQRAMLGYPPWESDDDEEAEVIANTPCKVEEFRLKRMAIEVQGGNVANILPTGASRGPPGAPQPEVGPPKPGRQPAVTGEPLT